ncbi:MAG: hypothetical protein R3Y59_02895 [bacterium]
MGQEKEVKKTISVSLQLYDIEDIEISLTEKEWEELEKMREIGAGKFYHKLLSVIHDEVELCEMVDTIRVEDICEDDE